MFRFALIACVTCLASLPASAATLGEEERFVVNPISGSDFEVIRLQHMAAAELWCAAASYVERRKGLAGTTEIYVREPLGPARARDGRKSVIFTVSKSGLPETGRSGLTLTVDVPGEAMKAHQARRYCRDAFTRSTK